MLSATILRGNSTLTFVVWIAWIFLFLRMVWKTVNWAVDFFVVTSQRMLLTSGVLTRKVAMMPLSKVTDMSFRRSFAGKLFGYGEFIVESAGQNQALQNVDHIPYPEQLYLEVCGLLFPPKPGSEDMPGFREQQDYRDMSDIPDPDDEAPEDGWSGPDQADD